MEQEQAKEEEKKDQDQDQDQGQEQDLNPGPGARGGAGAGAGSVSGVRIYQDATITSHTNPKKNNVEKRRPFGGVQSDSNPPCNSSRH